MMSKAVFIAVTAIAAILVGEFLIPEKTGNPFTTSFNTSYDYIVVGSGSAGSVIAARLSEDRDVTVLLLEAGGDDRNEDILTIPMGGIQAYHSKFDWEYYTEPQKHCCEGLWEKRSFWPRGKVLGGSSQFNGMMYVRGNCHDYDRWAASGCEGWSYKDVLPYFIKSENNQNDTLVETGYHGKGGPLPVSNTKTTRLVDDFIDAGKELGYKETDANGEIQEGFSRVQTTTKNGQRWSTSRSFLWPTIDRDNLHVAIKAHVTKVIIQNKRATGVKFIQDERYHIVKASKEVILSAGAVGSPQILMLSGIGPKKHLQDLRIPVHADLPVGKNLQDHLMTFLQISLNESMLVIKPETLSSTSAHLEYMLFNSGPLSSNYGLEVMAFVKTKPDEPSPDVQLHNYFTLVEKKAFEWLLSLDAEIFKKCRFDMDEGFIALPSLVRPRSRGEIRIWTQDPLEYPLIDPNYLADPEDVKNLLRGVRLYQRLIKTGAMQKLGARLEGHPVSMCSQFESDSDKYWKCYIRAFALTIYHPVGTCKMGAASDSTTVVDPQLRVKGISGLRVADASIMPTIVSGNIHAPTIMIAEKAADLIKTGH